ncbi:MAG: biotin/lipoyl-containing protein, partial [Planctomycetaceae bacterium]
MATEFKLPELGEGIESADVAQVLVKEGDEIQAEQPVLELETEKAVVEVPSPYSGKVTKVHVSEGDTIQVGQTLLTIDESDGSAKEMPTATAAKGPAKEGGEDRSAKKARDKKTAQPVAAAKQPAANKQAPETAKEPQRKSDAATASAPPVPTKGDGRQPQPPPAGPATRRLAHILEIPLDRLKGTGPRGRITLEDVVRAHDALEAKSFAGIPVPKLPDFRKEGEIEEVPLNKIAQTTIESLSRSWSIIPHVTQQGLADVTEVEALRLQYVERAGSDKPKVTMTAIAVKAVVALLKEFPR